MVWMRTHPHKIGSESYWGVMSDKETNFANKLLAVGTVEQQVALFQKKVRNNEIDTAVIRHNHSPILQMSHGEKANGT